MRDHEGRMLGPRRNSAEVYFATLQLRVSSVSVCKKGAELNYTGVPP